MEQTMIEVARSSSDAQNKPQSPTVTLRFFMAQEASQLDIILSKSKYSTTQSIIAKVISVWLEVKKLENNSVDIIQIRLKRKIMNFGKNSFYFN